MWQFLALAILLAKNSLTICLSTQNINQIISFSLSETNFNNDKVMQNYIIYDDKNTIIEAANIMKKFNFSYLWSYKNEYYRTNVE
jgi:hypothetical protein